MLLARYPPAPAPTDPYHESEIDLNRLTAHKSQERTVKWYCLFRFLFDLILFVIFLPLISPKTSVESWEADDDIETQYSTRKRK